MKRGILKIGDIVKYTANAKKKLSGHTDDKEHEVVSFTYEDIYSDNLECAEFEDGDGADVFWIKLVKSCKK